MDAVVDVGGIVAGVPVHQMGAKPRGHEARVGVKLHGPIVFQEALCLQEALPEVVEDLGVQGHGYGIHVAHGADHGAPKDLRQDGRGARVQHYALVAIDAPAIARKDGDAVHELHAEEVQLRTARQRHGNAQHRRIGSRRCRHFGDGRCAIGLRTSASISRMLPADLGRPQGRHVIHRRHGVHLRRPSSRARRHKRPVDDDLARPRILVERWVVEVDPRGATRPAHGPIGILAVTFVVPLAALRVGAFGVVGRAFFLCVLCVG
mmetsp:Transcript_57833/g.154907  ORF Transcript_57833/g.154907 Transcript_57833/m.154907 type:complete len:263 (+) Transcript_57833:407-1195(+)